MLIPAKEAAQRLAAALGETEAYWASRLLNDRRPRRRVKHPIPALREGGRIKYAAETVDRWATEELQRRLATGIAPVSRVAEVLEAYGIKDHGPGTGRTLSFTLNAAYDEETGEHYAQLIMNDPLRVYRLPAAQIRELAAEFNDLAKALDRWSASATTKPSPNPTN